MAGLGGLEPRILVTLALAALGGALFTLLDVPLAWMLGAIMATLIASIAGARLRVPPTWRSPVVAVLGVLLGSGFNTEMLGDIVQWLPIILILPVYVIVIELVSLVYLRHVAKLDAKTAFFCATPGGLGEMVLIGDQFGADMRIISLVHATRIMLVVFTIPLGFKFLGYIPEGAVIAASTSAGAVDLLVMLVSGAVGLVLGERLRLPAAALLGPMIASAGVHLVGLAHGAPPAILVGAAQLVLGALIGCRFTGYPVHRILVMILIGFGLTAVMGVTVAVMAALMTVFTGIDIKLLVLSLAPGGLAEMSLLALAFTDDPAFVATTHIVRIAIVVAMAAPLFALYRSIVKLPRD